MNLACTCGRAGTCVPCRIRWESKVTGKNENQVAREMADKAVSDSKKMRDWLEAKPTK